MIVSFIDRGDTLQASVITLLWPSGLYFSSTAAGIQVR